MADIRTLTAGQAARIDGIVGTLRPRGFDPEGLGVYGANVHAEPHGRTVDFWLEGEGFSVSGLLAPDGTGPCWIREDGRERMLDDGKGTHG